MQYLNSKLFIVLLISAISLFASPPSFLGGFTPSNSQKEITFEKAYMTVPDSVHAEHEHEILTTEPHIAGTEADRRTADYVLSQFRSAGLEAKIEEFQVPLSEPTWAKFSLIAPIRFSGPNPESVAADPASRDLRAVMPFNAYSASGEVTAQLVYANYGLATDYDQLQSRDVSVDGKIVLVRYGKSYRGVKVKEAEDRHASGVILYSDPNDDGYHAGEAYPLGPWRPSTGIQRGSVLYDFIHPGIGPHGDNMPRIPVLPISFADAKHLLENIGGIAAPPGWQGGLPFTYHLGPGPALVKLQVKLRLVVRPVWIVVATIPGSDSPEQVVITGNHRDAWVYGGVDSNSGTTALLEMARGFGNLLHRGWRPKRTIWLCSWDAEEPGELGSTLWAEKHSDELNEKAVAYLNNDSAVAGDHFTAAAVPSLKKFLLEVAADVPDPKGGSVLDQANQLFLRTQREVRAGETPNLNMGDSTRRESIRIGDLGGGTDFIAFIDHLGIPATDFMFDGDYGVYHSIFDNHRWMKQFGDPHFLYHVAAAQFIGLQVMRLADADLLPFDYGTYGREMSGYLAEFRKMLVAGRLDGQFDLGPAEQAAQELAKAGNELQQHYQSRLHDEHFDDLGGVNRALVKVEQAFLLPNGLPVRPWYKHAILAPGLHSGYDPVFLPGLIDSIDSGNLIEAHKQLEELVFVLRKATSLLRQAQEE
jgi:N-acetylated-alpha-linked acidic dipeptidase